MPDVISNTSCLISLDNIDQLSLLKDLYEKIVITDEVQQEFGKEIESRIQVRSVNDRSRYQILRNLVDSGEASVIALALEINDHLLILDDLKARKVAKSLHLRFTGVLGVMLRAKNKGNIKEIAPLLQQLKRVGFRISPAMEEEVLRLAGERA